MRTWEVSRCLITLLGLSVCLLLLNMGLIRSLYDDKSLLHALRPTKDNLRTTQTCAPWIPKHKRKIYISWIKNWHFNTFWEYFQSGRGHLRGESYWLVSVEYVLKHYLDFEMVQSLDFVALDALKHERAHRYLRMDELSRSNIVKMRMNNTAVVNQTQQITCKIREMQWWNEMDLDDFYFDYQHPFHPKQQISIFEEQGPFLDDKSVIVNYSKIPFFVHSQVTLPKPTEEEAKREKKGFLLHQGCEKVKRDKYNNRIMALLKAGFEIHTTCLWQHKRGDHGIKGQWDHIPQEYQHLLVHHGHLMPLDYSRLLRSMAFVFGFALPRDAPTPYEGLYNGAAYLNPVRNGTGFTQHRALVHQSPPYVYNYHPDNVTQFLEAAHSAHTNRFASFLLPEHTVEHVRDAVCKELVEANEPCEAHKYDTKDEPSVGFLHSFVDCILRIAIRLIYWVINRYQRIQARYF